MSTRKLQACDTHQPRESYCEHTHSQVVPSRVKGRVRVQLCEFVCVTIIIISIYVDIKNQVPRHYIYVATLGSLG